jgi:hypothetical protein
MAIPTVACLDTGSRGKDANLIAKNFVQRTLRVDHEEYPPDERPTWIGLGGVIEPLGRIELKIFPINWEDDGTQRKDTPVYLTFYVLEGRTNFGDILLGRDYCQLCAPSFHWSLKVDSKKTPGSSPFLIISTFAVWASADSSSTAQVEQAKFERQRREADRQRVAASRNNFSTVPSSSSQVANSNSNQSRGRA